MMNFKFSAFLFDAKKFFSIIFALIFPFLTALGITVPGQGAAVSENSIVAGCLYASTNKIRKTQLIDRVSTYHIALAKYETEACQLVLKASAPVNTLSWEMTDFENDNGDTLDCKVFQETYINVSTGKLAKYYPDALAPFSPGAFSIPSANENQPFLIQVTSTPETPSGCYKAVIFIKNNGILECFFEVTATVWNFTLPQTPSCETAMGLDKWYIAAKHGVDYNSAEATELYKSYYEYLLSRKVSAYNIPVDILSYEADAYMSDPRVTSFCIPYSWDDDMLVRYYEKVTSNPVWAAKAFFYPIDEPSTAQAYATYLQMTERLARLCPGYNMVTPFYIYKFNDSGIDFNSVEQQRGKSNIICSGSELFDEEGFAEQVAQRVAEGDKSWWYVCCNPKGDYCNIFTHWEGIQHRILFWQQKQFNVTGLLYWSTSYWADVEDVWTEALTTPWTGNDSFGDGSLFYNGNKVGINGPVSSLRLEAITDGIDDYEYLTIAERLFGREYVDKAIASISKSLTAYTYSDEDFADTREKIGNDISIYFSNTN